MKNLFFLLLCLFCISTEPTLYAQKDIFLNEFTDSALALDYECYAKAYNAAGTMIGAKFEANPFRKIKNFSNGKNALEEVIRANPENPEFRFIRLAVQLNIPKMLSYKDNVKEDTTFCF